jgi:hypothetical protein
VILYRNPKDVRGRGEEVGEVSDSGSSGLHLTGLLQAEEIPEFSLVGDCSVRLGFPPYSTVSEFPLIPGEIALAFRLFPGGKNVESISQNCGAGHYIK